MVADPARNNAFSYPDDQDGLRCPAGSHIRRANPRHGLPFEGKLVNRHRLIRRGIPYGDPLPPGADDDGPTAASSSCACRPASPASSSSCRRSGSTTATGCTSATTRTS